MSNTNRPTHLMIDLETLASTPDAAIVQLGVCFFQFTESGEPVIICRYAIDIEPEIGKRRADFDTIKWWMKQSEEARAAVFENPQRREHFEGAIRTLKDHMDLYCCDKRTLVFAAPATFDCGVLAHFAGQVGMELPWVFRQQRCMSSIGKFVGFDYKNVLMPANMPRLAHDAGNDAWAQACQMNGLYQFLRSKGITLEDMPLA